MSAHAYLSATALSKKTAATLDALHEGEQERLIILRNNAPAAVLLSFAAYEAMAEELENLRLANLALRRWQSFRPEEAISHEAMMRKYGQ